MREKTPVSVHFLVLFLLFGLSFSMFAGMAVAQDDSESFMWHRFTGPEVDESSINSDEDEWGFLDSETDCIYEGNSVSEGTRRDMGQYEEGEWSKDQEICVYTGNYEVGGEWVDPDSDYALDYIENNNLNGGRETDCYQGDWGGSSLKACEDRGSDTGFDSPFWAPFTEGERDDDYDSTGNADISFEGVHNKINVDSNNGNVDSYSTEWAFTPDLSYSVDQDGDSYPPGRCYPDGDTELRTSVSDPNISRSQRAAYNSFASSNGVWRDPDNLDSGVLDFSCDLTGPDLGIGYDTGGDTQVLDSGNGIKIYGDITFDDLGDSSAEVNGPVCGDDPDEYLLGELGQANHGTWDGGNLYCVPESIQNQCVIDNDGELELRETGTVESMDELGEDYGRIKNDESVCLKPRNLNYALWMDQDFSQNTCQENTLQGEIGVRWISASEIEDYPKAFTGGIDDSGNMIMERIIEDNDNFDKYQSLQGEVSSEVGEFETPVPTGKSTENPPDELVTNWTASKGFCAGDDEGEYLATQDCETDLCETDRTVIGAGKEPNRCVFDLNRSQYPVKGYSGEDIDSRQIYAPGDEVTFDLETERTMVCSGGTWYSEWPIVFNQKDITVPLDKTSKVSFQVINLKDSKKTFEVELKDLFVDGPSAQQFAKFVESDSEKFETTISGKSSKTFQIEIFGGSIDLDGERDDKKDKILVGANMLESDISGEDSAYVSVTDEGVEGSPAGPKNVPGISLLHVMALFLVSTMVYFVRY